VALRIGAKPLLEQELIVLDETQHLRRRRNEFAGIGAKRLVEFFPNHFERIAENSTEIRYAAASGAQNQGNRDRVGSVKASAAVSVDLMSRIHERDGGDRVFELSRGRQIPFDGMFLDRSMPSNCQSPQNQARPDVPTSLLKSCKHIWRANKAALPKCFAEVVQFGAISRAICAAFRQCALVVVV
jgi:hypothetical protein